MRHGHNGAWRSFYPVRGFCEDVLQGAALLYGRRKMKYIVSAQEMKACDRNTTDKIGMPSLVLMERAAYGVFEEIMKGPVPRRTLVAAGVGNNGGDGLAAGRLLALKGFRVDFFMAGNPLRASEETKVQMKILRNLGFPIQSKLEDAEYDMVIDALFGIGLSRDIEGGYAEVIEKINRLGDAGARIISVDIPSGICADTGKIMGCSIRARETVTFAFAKKGHFFYPGREAAGKLTVKDIGITEKSFRQPGPGAFCYEPGELAALLPVRNPAGNKGTFGKVLLIAGSRDMSGACTLSGTGVLRAGAGMLKIITPDCNRGIIQTTLPEAMLYSFQGTPDKGQVEKALEWADVLVAGPGMGQGENALRLMEQVMENKTLPMVIDADGLNLISAHDNLKKLLALRPPCTTILTPHPGELAHLMGAAVKTHQADREETARKLAEESGCIVAAKDAVTMVLRPGKREIYMNTSGNDGMACAGSGDVLAGIIGGLLAQGMGCFEGACLGVYLHGLAGDEASQKNGRFGMTASDIAKALTAVMGIQEEERRRDK